MSKKLCFLVCCLAAVALGIAGVGGCWDEVCATSKRASDAGTDIGTIEDCYTGDLD